METAEKAIDIADSMGLTMWRVDQMLWRVTLASAIVLLVSCVREGKTNNAGAVPDMASVAVLQAKVAALEAKQQVHEVYVNYGRGIDRLDEKSYRRAFWPDAQINYGTLETITVDEHWTKHMLNWHKAKLSSWAHLLTNESVDIEGDVAHVEIYVTPMWVPSDPNEKKDWFLLSGRYIDRLDRRNGEWRISVREFVPQFAMKVDTTPFDATQSAYTKGTKSDCTMRASGDRDTSYVRPLNRRAETKDGPPCANSNSRQ